MWFRYSQENFAQGKPKHLNYAASHVHNPCKVQLAGFLRFNNPLKVKPLIVEELGLTSSCFHEVWPREVEWQGYGRHSRGESRDCLLTLVRRIRTLKMQHKAYHWYLHGLQRLSGLFGRTWKHYTSMWLNTSRDHQLRETQWVGLLSSQVLFWSPVNYMLHVDDWSFEHGIDRTTIQKCKRVLEVI